MATDAIAPAMPEWIALPDADGHVCARYSPVHDLLVIKRRGVEKRYNLTELKKQYQPPIDKSKNSC